MDDAQRELLMDHDIRLSVLETVVVYFATKCLSSFDRTNPGLSAELIAGLREHFDQMKFMGVDNAAAADLITAEFHDAATRFLARLSQKPA
jgi:hypothetical protein